jgi:hypothetical protein
VVPALDVSTLNPPLEVDKPVPVVSTICPPVCTVLNPEETATSPPLPQFPLPTLSKMSPPFPLVAAPDIVVINPLFPELVVPVLNVMAPLTPNVPAFTVLTWKEPLVVETP